MADPDDKNATYPELVRWKVKKVTENSMILSLEFSNILYVSSFGYNDKLSIAFVNETYFCSDICLASGYSISRVDIPTQVASLADQASITTVGDLASNSLIYTLVVPFCFMVFMKASMGRVWSFYNLLQLAANIKNYTTLYIPSNALFILDVLDNTASFKITSHFNGDGFQNFIFGQGPLITAVIFVFGTLIFVKIL